MNVRVFDDPPAVAGAAASVVADAIEGGVRSLVLAGGSTPTRAYELLQQAPLEWGRVTVLFGDERCVPPDHPDSNYLMARRSLLDRVSPGSVHRMAGELGPEAAASLYEPIVRWLSPLDLVLLGMGPDGHTASLFPGRPEVSAEGTVVGVRGAPKPPPERVSLTLGARPSGSCSSSPGPTRPTPSPPRPEARCPRAWSRTPSTWSTGRWRPSCLRPPTLPLRGGGNSGQDRSFDTVGRPEPAG
jgi:6-phosphogluconolactonase